MEQALNYIYSRRKFAKSNGLERISELLNRLHKPQNKMRLIHVVGTNGKGSTSTMVSFSLKKQGYKVGLFTSPFVLDFLERIQINNEFVDKSLFLECVEIVKEKINEIEKENLSPTFFETVLAIALLCFEKSGCDICILEAGIGGRDDSTNVIQEPDVFVLTSVSLDHTEVLGDSIRKIAESKCGAIKKGSSVICFPDDNKGFDFAPQEKETIEVITDICNKYSNKLVIPDLSDVCSFEENENGIKYLYKGLDINIGFYGAHQLANSLVAINVLKELNNRDFIVSDESIIEGLKESFIPCRMEKLKFDNKDIILDGGHNPGCMLALSKMIKSHYPNKKITAVMSFMKDKDIEKSIEIVAPLFNEIIFTITDEIRGASLAELEHIGSKYCKDIKLSSQKIKAFKSALDTDSDLIVCSGSFYLVSDIRNYIVKGKESL